MAFPDSGPSLDELVSSVRNDVPDDAAWTSAETRLQSALEHDTKESTPMWTFLFSFSVIRSSIVGATTLVGIGAGLFLGMNPTSHGLALSGVLAQLEEISSYSANILIDTRGPDPTKVVLSYSEPGHLRINTNNMVTVIMNQEEQEMLVLTAGAETAIKLKINGQMDRRIEERFSEHLWLDKLKSYRGEAEEELGEREVNGVMATGFVATIDDVKMTIWADNETELPVHILAEPIEGNVQITIDLAYDLEFDADFFSVEPPEGCRLMNIDLDHLENLNFSPDPD